MTIRTRFAPSPTGDLHVGNIRTALYAWLFAKHHNGTFVLRIEDTDVQRANPLSVQTIIDSLHWLGLTIDEGPYYQTKRLALYQTYIEKLLTTGNAYPCFCSKQRLETLRQKQLDAGEKPRYDGHCRQQYKGTFSDADKKRPHVIRFCTPTTGNVQFSDRVLGELFVNNSELDDWIMVRSDAMPTYNFTVVVDDLEMAISDVIRGNGHVDNTFKQINLFKALGAAPKQPVYAHVSTILDTNKQKLSKRNSAASILEYQLQGYLPQALLNYLLRLGWSSGDQEIFSKQQMIDLFDLKNLSKSPAIFDMNKLSWMNQYYLKKMPIESLKQALMPFFIQRNITMENGPTILALLPVLRGRAKTLNDLVQQAMCFYMDSVSYDASMTTRYFNDSSKPLLESLKIRFEQLLNWNQENIERIIKLVLAEHTLKFPQLAQPLRVALTGNTSSPSIGITVFLLGKQRTIQRLHHVITHYFAA